MEKTPEQIAAEQNYQQLKERYKAKKSGYAGELNPIQELFTNFSGAVADLVLGEGSTAAAGTREGYKGFSLKEIRNDPALNFKFQKDLDSLPMEKQLEVLQDMGESKKVLSKMALDARQQSYMQRQEGSEAGATEAAATEAGKTEAAGAPADKQGGPDPRETVLGIAGGSDADPASAQGALAQAGIFGPESIRLGRIAHNAQLYHNIAIAQKGIANEITEMLSTLYDPTGKFKISGQEAQQRFKPQVSRRALDEKIERGPQQFEDPEFKTSETAILANAITSAIGSVFKNIGLNAAGADTQAMATTEIPPEVAALAQGSNMIMSDVAKHDQKVAQIEELNRRLSIKHEGDIEAMERDFDAQSDMADRIYKNSLENFMRFQTQRYDQQKGLAMKMDELSRQTMKTEDAVRLGVDKFNQMQGTTEQKFNAMMKMQYKKMVYATQSAQRYKRAANISYDVKAAQADALKAAHISKSASYYNFVDSADALNQVPAVLSARSDFKSISRLNAGKLLEEFRYAQSLSPEAGRRYYNNATLMMTNGFNVTPSRKLTDFLAKGEFSIANKMVVKNKKGREFFHILMSDDEQGQSLAKILEEEGVLRKDENGRWDSNQKNAALARMAAFPLSDLINKTYIQSEQSIIKTKDGFETKTPVVESLVGAPPPAEKSFFSFLPGVD